MAQNDAIGQLNEGLKMFKKQTLSSLDTHAKACIDVAIVTFNDNVDVIQNFAPVEDMIAPTLTASGRTAMGGALEKAMDMITQQKEIYNYAGTQQTEDSSESQRTTSSNMNIPNNDNGFDGSNNTIEQQDEYGSNPPVS